MVDAITLAKRTTQCKMDGSTDLFIVQDVIAETVDAKIRPHPKFSNAVGALIRLDDIVQQFFVILGCCS